MRPTVTRLSADRGRRPIVLTVAAGVVALVLPFALPSYQVFQCSQVIVYAIALLGLNILTGYNGQISLGHGAFYAIGAYISAILVTKGSFSYWLTIPIAALLTFVVGYLFGRPALRLAGHYLSLATFALGIALPQLLKYRHLEPWTGGAQGMTLPKPKVPFGLPLSQDQWLYYVSLGVAFVLFALAIRMLSGRVGRALVAIREQPVAASAMGIDIAGYKSLTFGISAMYTGVAGALAALLVQFVAPDGFSTFLSVTFLLGIVIGGIGTISGAIYGACFIHFVPNLAADFSKAAPWAVFGVVLILCVLTMPAGIAGLLHQLGGWTKILIAAGSLTAVAIFARTGSPRYDPGVSDTEIKIGNIMPYSGAASSYGVVGKTQAAYFRMVNANGGINGRKINFVSLDGAYNPAKSLEMARRLVEREEVLLVLSPVGTPPTLAIYQYLNEKKVPLLLIASGAHQWNDPEHFPWTTGAIPECVFEGELYARYILEHQPNGRIAILYQNDDFGRDYLKGVRQVLGRKAGMIVGEASYEVSEPVVDSQIVQLRQTGADVLLIVCTPKAAAQAIRKIYDIGWRPTRYLSQVSSSIAAVLAPAGLEKSSGILCFSYMKDASSAQWANDDAVKKWQDFMRTYYPEGDIRDRNTMTGYNYCEALVHILRKAGNNLTRANIAREATNLKGLQLPLCIPGITMNTNPEDYAPFRTLQMTRFDGAQWVPVGEVFRAEEKSVQR